MPRILKKNTLLQSTSKLVEADLNLFPFPSQNITDKHILLHGFNPLDLSFYISTFKIP